LQDEDGAAETLVQYEVKIAALERKVGQLTMEIDLLKKTPRLKVVSSSESLSVVSGPKPAAPSVGAVKRSACRAAPSTTGPQPGTPSSATTRSPR